MDLATVREKIHTEDREAVFRTAEGAILRGVHCDSEHRSSMSRRALALCGKFV